MATTSKQKTAPAAETAPAANTGNVKPNGDRDPALDASAPAAPAGTMPMNNATPVDALLSVLYGNPVKENEMSALADLLEGKTVLRGVVPITRTLTATNRLRT